MSGSIYQRVPKPPALLPARHPHVGEMPVPWVTCYGEGAYSLDYTSPVGLALACDCTLGVGIPELGKQCPVRQRIAMTQRRCSACGTRINGVALFAGVTLSELPGEPTRVPITCEAPHPPPLPRVLGVDVPEPLRQPRRVPGDARGGRLPAA